MAPSERRKIAPRDVQIVEIAAIQVELDLDEPTRADLLALISAEH